MLIDGEVMRVGGRHLDAAGYDLMGVLTGSEGLLGVVTEVTVRLLRRPPSAQALLAGFASNEAGGEAVAAIIAAGIIPAGMEMMDRPAIAAVEEFVHAGYPLDAEALLIVELDGTAAEVDELMGAGEGDRRSEGRHLVARQPVGAGAADVLGRAQGGVSGGGPHLARLSLHGRHHSAHQLPLVLTRMAEMSQRFGLRVANVFHAGDGNLHPLILYDANKPGELEAAEQFGAEILKLCVEVGGVLTGEHGVGVEKRDLMPFMFSEVDLDQQMRLKCAFDPEQLLNPGKVFPNLHRCAEFGAMHVRGGNLPFPDLPRF